MVSIQNSTECHEKKTERYCYVQQEGELWSPLRPMLDAIAESKSLPYRIKDRNPRSSFEGWRGWAHREAAIVNYHLEALPRGHVVFRGNLKLPLFASPSVHEGAKSIFSRYLKRVEKKVGRTIRFRAVADHADPENRHYDFVLFADSYSFRQVKKIIKTAAEKAGFKVTCRPVATKAQRVGTVRYIHKCEMKPQKGDKYVYLPAKDGSRLVWGSKDFFQGQKKADLWEKVKEAWGVKDVQQPEAVQSNYNKQIDTPPVDELDAIDRLSRQVASMLPQTAVDADFGRWKPRKLAWLTGWWEFNVLQALNRIPNVQQTADGCFCLPRGYPVPTPSTGRQVPYHREFNPLVEDRLEGALCEVEVRTRRPVNEKATEELTTEDFFKELEAMM